MSSRSFSSRLVPGHLAIGLYRLLQAREDWEELSGALFGSDGYVYRYVARPQALSQLLVKIRSAPAGSQRNGSVMAEVVASGLRVCFRMIVVDSRPQPLNSEPPGDPWAQNAVSDNVAGMAAVAIVLNFDDGPAPHLSAWTVGCELSRGEPRMPFPPDAGPQCRARRHRGAVPRDVARR